MDRDRWSLLSPLLDRALELSAPNRESWLDELREQSPELAADVTSILSGELLADQRSFLIAPLNITLQGLELGAYTLERPLGQGGMGSVWLARRIDGRFEGHAAVKLLNLALVTPTGQERFRREGSALARLTHPGIARLLDAGVSPSNQPYLVLEHIDGERIDAYADGRNLSREARIRLFLQVLDAVGHAHANLIVHRDLKPSNILVTHDGAVKLLDFGIAKLLDAEVGDERGALTVEGTRALTPDFAAPEQVTGDAITTATDVYSLGVLLYILLAGRHPVATRGTFAAGVVRTISDAEPAPLHAGDLDTILYKALRWEPGERYQTVRAFADDLARYLRHEPVSARRASLAYRAGKFVRRNRVGVASAAAALVALAAATVFSVSQMQEARRQRDVAVDARKRVAAQSEFQSLLMSQVSDQPITMREMLDRGRNALEREYSGDPRFLSMMLMELSKNYSELGDSKTRGALLARAESIAVASGHTEQLAEIRCNVADNLRIQGSPDLARRTLLDADILLRAVPQPEAEAACLVALADLENEVGDAARGATAIRRAIAIRDSIGDAKDLAYDGMLSTLAETLDRQGLHRDAIAEFRRAEAAMDSTGRGETMDRTIIQHNRAVSLVKLGETADAERILHDVLARAARSDPAAHFPPQPAIHYAQTALFNRHSDSAAKYFGLLAAQAVQERNSYWEGRALFGLVQAQLQRGRFADARSAVARFRPIGDNPKLRSTDDEVVDGRMLDAQLAIAAGDTASAYSGAVEVLRANGYFAGARRAVLRGALVFAAEAALATERPDSALAFARAARAIATRDALTETRSAYVGEARLVEGRALLAIGDTSAARATFERALVALRSGGGAAHPRTREVELQLGGWRPASPVSRDRRRQ